jgi:cyclopropane fatty-acyl-phospholipid synthase-like methyltransferase
MNGFINDFIIDEIISVRQAKELKVFDIGFGIGAFIRMLIEKTNEHTDLIIEGCEPSEKNYSYFKDTSATLPEGTILKTHLATFLETESENKFDFITAIYVFPHIAQDELAATVKKIYSMLMSGGRFVMVVVNEHYLKEKMEADEEVFTLLDKYEVDYGGRKYKEYLYHTYLPGIGRILDYSREEEFYKDFFEGNGLSLVQKNDLEDSGYICSAYVFQKDAAQAYLKI